MRRRAGVVHPARRRLPSFLLDLETKPVVKWAPHLRLAFEILKGDLGLPEPTARIVLKDSISAAHECAQAINQRSGQIFESETRAELHNRFRRIANCIKRSPLRLRERLDERIDCLVKKGVIDLEVVEAVFDTTAAVFAEFPDIEPSRTALRSICGKPSDGAQVVLIKNDYASIGPIYQRRAEDAAVTLLSSASGQAHASGVFEALAGALGSEQDINPGSQIYDLIVHYVVEVAKAWRQVGLRPSRARHPEDPTYKSKFHRFVDLVLADKNASNALSGYFEWQGLAMVRKQLTKVRKRLAITPCRPWRAH